MPLGFGLHTSCAGFDVLLDKFTKSGPGIVVPDEIDSLILSRVSGEDMVMLVVENTELEVIGVWNIDEVVLTEESIRGDRPTGLRFCLVGNVEGVIGKCG